MNGNVQEFNSENMIHIKYDRKMLKKDINRFSEKGIFLSDKKKDEIKNELLTGKKNLLDFKSNTCFELDLSDEQWDKIIKMSSENFIFFIDECNPIEKDIKEVISEIEKINTECLYKLIEKEMISDEEIIKACGNAKIGLEELIELASVEIIGDNIIIDSFNLLEENKNEELIDKEYLLKYFNIDKIKQYIENEQINNKFLEFYNKILTENENEKNEILNELRTIISEIYNKEIIIKFYDNALIGNELLDGKIDDDNIFDMYEKGQISIELVNKLYKNKIIEQDTFALIMDEDLKNKDMIQALDEGKLDLSTALILYSDKKVYGIEKKYKEGIFKTSSPAIYGFATSNLDIEPINELYKKGIVKEKDLIEAINGKKFSISKITELYINMLISEEVIDKAFESGIISKNDNELMKKALGMKNISENMDKSLGIAFGSNGEIELDEGIFLPEEKLGRTEKMWGGDFGDNLTNSPRIKRVISPAIREKKMETYGAKRIKRNNVEYNEKSPFNDYEFYILPNEYGEINQNSIVIAERYYQDKHSGENKLIDGNATYLFELKDLTRISKKSKTEVLEEMKIAKDSKMKRLLHSKHWAKNLDIKIKELLGKELSTCYTEKELKNITILSTLIDGIEEKGKVTRLFDIDFI